MKVLYPIFTNIKSFYKNKKTLFCSSENTKKIIFNYGVTSLPHVEKRAKGGEDSHCASSEILSVADGVGGWNEVGVDPSLYSNNLCSNIIKFFEESSHSLSIKEIFVKSCKHIEHRGSSTCTIASIKNKDDKVYIEALNLGDSGYLILRPELKDQNIDFSIIHKSEEQTHSFNFPFQVGEGGDNPELAEVKLHQINLNDVIILATDGLWDNLSNEQIILILKKYYDIQKEEAAKNNIEIKDPLTIQPKRASEVLTYTAEYVSLDQNYVSPFATRSKGLYRGGKHDDITVIVAQVIADQTTIKF